MHYLAADVGGTFTDLVLVDTGNGRLLVDKVSSQATGSAGGVEDGIERICRAAGIAPGAIDLFVHGFTVGTNALLTRRGAEVALVVSRGMRDVLVIGDQMRPELYALTGTKPPPVVPRARTIEADERLDAFGATVTELTEAEAARVADAVATLAPQSVAISLGFSYLNADHELMLERAIRARLSEIPIYLSTRVNPQIEEYPRTNTTAVAAYVGPIIGSYIDLLEGRLAGLGVKAPLRLMRSDGGVATPRAAHDNPAHMLLSGPAAGVVAGAWLSAEIGAPDLVTFDMGGTSADFSTIIGGKPSTIQGRHVAGQPLRLPTLDIETISAGGGSIARVDVGGALQIGPDSAGAVPGPACYGQGGEAATITDASVVMGLIHPDEFLGGEIRLDADAAHRAVERAVAKPLGLNIEEAAFGIISVANANMIQAIRTLSVERGHDVRGFGLLAFGGAGPIYGAYMARELGMAEVIAPAHPGVFCALGLLLTDIRHSTQTAWQMTLAKANEAELGRRLATLRAELDAALESDGVKPGDRYFRFHSDMRALGQFHQLQIPLPDGQSAGWFDKAALAREFHAMHERAYGHADPNEPVEFVNLRGEGFGRMGRPKLPRSEKRASGPAEPAARRRVYFDRTSGRIDCPVYRREALLPGHELDGPAIVTQRDSTVLVLPDQAGIVDPSGVIRVRSKRR
jgi:N-methylhydantoinase A